MKLVNAVTVMPIHPVPRILLRIMLLGTPVYLVMYAITRKQHGGQEQYLDQLAIGHWFFLTYHSVLTVIADIIVALIVLRAVAISLQAIQVNHLAVGTNRVWTRRPRSCETSGAFSKIKKIRRMNILMVIFFKFVQPRIE
jgi:hypothetical protein